MNKTCLLCLSEFTPESKVPWLEKFCSKTCRLKAQNLKKNYNLTIEDYQGLLSRQGGKCKIQGCERTDLAVDHDHKCCPEKATSCGACVRGLICRQHNVVMGMVNDNITELLAIADYLAGARELQTTYNIGD